ncbi:hypothetical protein VTO42DRAFT_4807 [Malbranchea cinnamomea]
MPVIPSFFQGNTSCPATVVATHSKAERGRAGHLGQHQRRSNRAPPPTFFQSPAAQRHIAARIPAVARSREVQVCITGNAIGLKDSSTFMSATSAARERKYQR